jgi:hypothetical protein
MPSFSDNKDDPAFKGGLCVGAAAGAVTQSSTKREGI